MKILAISLLLPACLPAGTIYSNFPPSSSNSFGGSGSLIATRFRATQGGTLDTVRLPAGSPGSLELTLYGDAGGSVGALLESWRVS